MIKVGAVYLFAGIVFAAISILSGFDRSNPQRWGAAAFWGLFAASFLFGDRVGDFANGVLVIAMALIAGLVGLGVGKAATSTENERTESADRLGSRLFAPILVIPACALLGTLLLKSVQIGGAPLADPSQATVIATAIGVVGALALAMAIFRPPVIAPAEESRRILDQVGSAAMLPQLLAALGGVFALAGVGASVSQLIGHWLPMDSHLTVVVAFCLGMAIFTLIMGNAFAAFPVMAAGIGAPLIVGRFGGDPAVMGALGMLAGYCGTLMTPMAAHNIIPAALLDLPTGSVIRAQAPTALIVLGADILLMYWLAFR
ncbi:MAG TPA: DUF979 domain-containing protein [Caulobacteraceae bacterium]|jgi:uncharacterized membrane protein